MSIQSQSAPLVFGRECLDTLTASASASVRLRKNLDFHAAPAHPAQRLLNAVEPGSYVRPHRHVRPLKDETVLAVRGAFGVVFFDEAGGVAKTAVIRPGGDFIGVNIPASLFHSLVSLESGSIFFESKAGPYDPQTDKEWAPWAPPEGHHDAPEYFATLKALFQAELGV